MTSESRKTSSSNPKDGFQSMKDTVQKSMEERDRRSHSVRPKWLPGNFALIVIVTFTLSAVTWLLSHAMNSSAETLLTTSTLSLVVGLVTILAWVFYLIFKEEGLIAITAFLVLLAAVIGIWFVPVHFEQEIDLWLAETGTTKTEIAMKAGMVIGGVIGLIAFISAFTRK